jgi:hypothetical protein
MIRHKLPNKTENATVAEPKLFHQLNNPLSQDVTVISMQDDRSWSTALHAPSSSCACKKLTVWPCLVPDSLAGIETARYSVPVGTL